MASSGLIVDFKDGPVLVEITPRVTYIEVIRHLGIETIKRKCIEISKKELLTPYKKYRNQVEISSGRWLTIPDLIKQKANWIRVIALFVHKEVEVLIIDDKKIDKIRKIPTEDSFRRKQMLLKILHEQERHEAVIKNAGETSNTILPIYLVTKEKTFKFSPENENERELAQLILDTLKVYDRPLYLDEITISINESRSSSYICKSQVSFLLARMEMIEEVTGKRYSLKS